MGGRVAGVLYRAVFDHALTRLDPEDAHDRAFHALQVAGYVPGWRVPGVARAPRTVMGLRFPHPFGLAAGFDKDARAVLPLLALGFGHVEVGTVTARPQSGNLRPRLFRLVPDRAIVNRMGFNNDGAEVVTGRLAGIRRTRDGRDAVIGVNIGKTKAVPADEAVADYVASTRHLAPYASYLVVNVSSPNTPGLRDLQAVTELGPLLSAVRAEAERVRADRLPLLVKIAPDLADADVDDIADLAVELGLDGVIATNTTIERPATLATSSEQVEAAGPGGLSGPVLAERSTQVLRRLRERAGDRLALVSVGGIMTGADARGRLEAGADLVQGYTGLVYEGPLWPRRITREFADQQDQVVQ